MATTGVNDHSSGSAGASNNSNEFSRTRTQDRSSNVGEQGAPSQLNPATALEGGLPPHPVTVSNVNRNLEQVGPQTESYVTVPPTHPDWNRRAPLITPINQGGMVAVWEYRYPPGRPTVPMTNDEVRAVFNAQQPSGIGTQIGVGSVLSPNNAAGGSGQGGAGVNVGAGCSNSVQAGDTNGEDGDDDSMEEFFNFDAASGDGKGVVGGSAQTGMN